MKIVTFILVSILFSTVYTAQAQTPVMFRYKSDPGYSVRNYKHPHKAAIAEKYNLDAPVRIPYIEPVRANDLSLRNYKAPHMAANNQPSTGLVVKARNRPSYRHSIDSPANYKRQF